MSYIVSKEIIFISSKDRTNGTISNFKYAIASNVSNKYTHIGLLNCSVPKSFYLVQANLNTFTLEEKAVQVSITIGVGNYSQSTLRTEITTKLNAGSPNGWTYAISYSAQTGKFTFTVSGNAGNQPKLIFGTNLYTPMGFDRNSTNTFVGDSLTSSNLIVLQRGSISVVSDIIDAGVGSPILQTINSSVVDFSYINYSCDELSANSRLIRPQNNGSYQFSLIDSSDGSTLDLNGADWNMTIVLYRESDIFTIIENYAKYRMMNK